MSKPDISGWTTPRQFRLTAETMAELDWLCLRLGGLSRTDVLRLAIRRLAQSEGYEAPPDANGAGAKPKAATPRERRKKGGG